MIFNAQIDILLIAIAFSLFGHWIQIRFGSRKQLKEYQQKIRESNKKLIELSKRTDEKSRQELAALQQEMFSAMAEQWKTSMRLIILTAPIYLIAFIGIGWIYGKEIINLPIPIPWFGGEGQSFITFYNQTNWIGWYLLCALISSIIINFLLGIIEKRKENANKT